LHKRFQLAEDALLLLLNVLSNHFDGCTLFLPEGGESRAFGWACFGASGNVLSKHPRGGCPLEALVKFTRLILSGVDIAIQVVLVETHDVALGDLQSCTLAN